MVYAAFLLLPCIKEATPFTSSVIFTAPTCVWSCIFRKSKPNCSTFSAITAHVTCDTRETPRILHGSYEFRAYFNTMVKLNCSLSLYVTCLVSADRIKATLVLVFKKRELSNTYASDKKRTGPSDFASKPFASLHILV